MAYTIAQRIGKLLVAKNLTLSVCESCTGGMLGSIITSVAGSSRYFLGGILAYADIIKQDIVGVRSRTLKRHGAVSAAAVREMALGVQKRVRSDIGIAITGIAGPGGGSGTKPIGTVYIAIVARKRIVMQRCLFKGSRQAIRRAACAKALGMLEQMLLSI
jgi:PncC family amidohydrolase